MERKNTTEFNDIITYMTNVLGCEFPIREFTPNYLILSILDNPSCHAAIIIDNILMSDSIEYLRDYYSEEIKSRGGKPIINNETRFSDALVKIMNCANDEMDNLSSSYVGTEHILLAILNPKNNISSANKLMEQGLKYGFILDKCSEFTNKEDKSYINNNHRPMNKIPLKSEVNSIISVQDGNTPNVNKYTINLHREILKGHYDQLIGREDILNNIIKVLSRRRKNNVILVGKPGTGKTSIAYRLTEMIDSGNVPDILREKEVIMLDTVSLVSGTHLRGMLEERVNGLFKELKSNPNYILFIDDMQNVIKTSTKDKDADLSDMIGKILTGGEVRVIGTINFKDYRNGIENNSVLSTKLQKIIIEPSSVEETFKILQENKHYYETFHHVKFNDDCLYKAIKLAKRYITNNNLPDSALDVIDLTGASISLNTKQSKSLKTLKKKLSSLEEDKKKAMNSGNFEKLDEIAKKESSLNKEISDITKKYDNDDSTWLNVTENDIAETVSSITTIPISKLSASSRETILNIDKILKKDVIGQDEAINEIAKAIKRSKAGFNDKSKTLSTLMLIGKTSVGKTLIAKKLAENIFGDEKALVRFDMSEYQDKTSINKLIGSSAGYVGYDNGGLLTEAIKNKPYCVLLFDEIEKADESIYNLFLQLFDEGRLTDNNGTTVNFKNVIVIMTSNVGAKQASEMGNGIGFQSNGNDFQKSIIEKSLKNKFNPEFLSRIDKIIHFNNLTDENLKTITGIELRKLADRVKENKIYLEYGEDVVDFIYEKALLEKEYGARPIAKLIQDNVSDKIVDLVLSSKKKENKYHISIKDNDVNVDKL